MTHVLLFHLKYKYYFLMSRKKIKQDQSCITRKCNHNISIESTVRKTSWKKVTIHINILMMRLISHVSMQSTGSLDVFDHVAGIRNASSNRLCAQALTLHESEFWCWYNKVTAWHIFCFPLFLCSGPVPNQCSPEKDTDRWYILLLLLSSSSL